MSKENSEIIIKHYRDWVKERDNDDPIVFSVNEAPGALPNGTLIRKIKSVPEDAHPDGTKGVIIGSFGPADYEDHKEAYIYFVIWNTEPIPIGISSWRIEKI